MKGTLMKGTARGGAGAVQAGPDRPHRNGESFCDFGIGHAAPGEEQQHVAVGSFQPGQHGGQLLDHTCASTRSTTRWA